MSAGSRSHYMNGHATRIAGAELVKAMRKPDGTFRTYAEMVRDGIPTRYRGEFEAGHDPGLCRLDPNTGMGDPTPAYTYALNAGRGGAWTRRRGRTKVDPLRLRGRCREDRQHRRRQRPGIRRHLAQHRFRARRGLRRRQEAHQYRRERRAVHQGHPGRHRGRVHRGDGAHGSVGLLRVLGGVPGRAATSPCSTRSTTHAASGSTRFRRRGRR